MSEPSARIGALLGVVAVLIWGPALPTSLGLAAPLLAVAALAGWLWWGARSGAEKNDDPPSPVAPLALAARAVLAAAALGSLAVLVIIRPAAMWGAAAALLAAVAVARSSGPSRGVVSVLGVLAVVLFGVVGSNLEWSDPVGRGAAHSGPISGVRPLQMISVRIDGDGPHDILIDDYVEPDGTRGYSPEQWADRLERQVHEIGRIRLADAPARTRHAFEHAQVRPTAVPRQPDWSVDLPSRGFTIESGTHGPGSRVEFVCPGRPSDPRPRRKPVVARDHCPSKYAAEGNAGLSLMPRWPGYTEVRGSARFSLARLLGRSHTEDAEGARTTRDESGLWVVLLGLALGLSTLVPNAREGFARAGSVLVVEAVMVACVCALVLAHAPSFLAVPAGWDPRWLVIVVVAGLATLPGTRGSSQRWGILLLVVGTWAAASLGGRAVEFAPDPARVVVVTDAIAGVLADGLGVRYPVCEGIAGGAMAGAMVLGAGACLPSRDERKTRPGLALACFLAMIGLAVARKVVPVEALLLGAAAFSLGSEKGGLRLVAAALVGATPLLLGVRPATVLAAATIEIVLFSAVWARSRGSGRS